MNDNVVIAIIAASAVIISAVCVLGGAIFAYISGNKHLDKRLDKIDMSLQLIQSDLREFFNQVTKIRAHIKLD